MKTRTTISTFELFAMFPDAESARVYLEARLWPTGPRCPVCGLGERITVRRGGYYRCNQCAEDFTVRTGTLFERSHVPLHKWLYAMYLLVTARKGISSLQLSKQIGVTQKSAWFMLHRLRERGDVPAERRQRRAADARAGRQHHHGRARSPADLRRAHGMKPPKALDRLADVVLAYHPKPKSEPAKKRQRRRKRLAKKKG